MIEVEAAGGVNYAVVRNGRVVRGFFADWGVGAADARISVLMTVARGGSPVRSSWPGAATASGACAPLGHGVYPCGYRDLMVTVRRRRLVDGGATQRPGGCRACAQSCFVDSHPALERLSVLQRIPDARSRSPKAPRSPPRDRGAWLAELLWAAAPPDGLTPERLIGELTRERRHVFQSAGLFDGSARGRRSGDLGRSRWERFTSSARRSETWAT